MNGHSVGKKNDAERKERFSFLNPLVSVKPWRLFELCDLSIMPPFLRRCSQSILTAHWTSKIPLIQPNGSPASIAARLLLRTLDTYKDLKAPSDNSHFSIIDFCSGAGGPVPKFEHLVNADRTEKGLAPIPFLLTDIKPHLDSWIAAVENSDRLSFVPQPVDATNPPAAAISESSGSTSRALGHGYNARNDSRVFRLYCLAFHHFDDEMAAKVLKSTMDTAEGFAILELQERRLGSLVLMLLDFYLLFFVGIFWFWREPLILIFTYVFPILPFVQSFDGFVSALRTRTFDEVISLIPTKEVVAYDPGNQDGSPEEEVREGPVWDAKSQLWFARRGDWVFEGGRELHTWPIGYMNWVVGRKIQ
ncbi:hypothetical protein K402DRAFT_327245 [Aulographum hederae CBS 113979]|uniref:Uncharacterized protein n=1 Tax=Aulographum hederae CBS 113979 TaxID=1176131 RepID=A0A6G1H788_9PEZI|nr:hypothetical protein K402DRAFT_327245 [Aulographum hederae CBS 113979]